MTMELLVAVVIASFVGSLHCVGMCGPLVAFAVGDPGGRGRRRGPGSTRPITAADC